MTYIESTALPLSQNSKYSIITLVINDMASAMGGLKNDELSKGKNNESLLQNNVAAVCGTEKTYFPACSCRVHSSLLKVTNIQIT